MTDRFPARLVLSKTDRDTLEGWLRRRSTAQSLALRARIVLVCAEPQAGGDSAVAGRLKVSRLTVSKWRRRFQQHGVQGLLDAPRPGAPRSIPDERIEQALALTLDGLPPDGSWSTRRLASELGMSQASISRLWRALAAACRPGEAFARRTGPQPVEQVRGIAGLYLRPPVRALVLEVTPRPVGRPAAAEETPVPPGRPGALERQVREWVRRRTDPLFEILDRGPGPAAAETRPASVLDFVLFLGEIEGRVPAEGELHLLLDDAGLHRAPLLREWLALHPRVRAQAVAAPDSWRELAQDGFLLLMARETRRGRLRSTFALEQALRIHRAGNEAEARPFAWTAARPVPAAWDAPGAAISPPQPGDSPPGAGVPPEPAHARQEAARELVLRHIAEGEARVARQAALVARLAESGRDTTMAQALLESFRKLLALSYEHLAGRGPRG